MTTQNESPQSEPAAKILNEIRERLVQILNMGKARLEIGPCNAGDMTEAQIASAMCCTEFMIEIVDGMLKKVEEIEVCRGKNDLYFSDFMWSTLAPIMLFIYSPHLARDFWVMIRETFRHISENVPNPAEVAQEQGKDATKH